MTVIELMTLLNSSNEIFSHLDVLFFWYDTKLLIDDPFELFNGQWIVPIYVVLQEPTDIKKTTKKLVLGFR